ncbi:unnamed protein product [Merluccius merluccius]
MDHCVQRLYLESHNQLKKCLTAYHVAKTEQPFTQYASLLNLQTTNGVDVGSRYGSDQACRRSASADMLGRARQCIQVLKDYKHLLFVALVQDNPREWPSDKQDLAHYGSDFLHTVTGHFAEVLDRNGCDRKKANILNGQLPRC